VTQTRGTWLAACVILLVGSAVARAADYRVRAYILPDRDITDTQSVRLVIQVEGRVRPNVQPFELAGLKNLAVVSGPSTQTKFVATPGRTTSTLELSYTLLPNRAGPAQIPGFDVLVDAPATRAARRRASRSCSCGPSWAGTRSGSVRRFR